MCEKIPTVQVIHLVALDDARDQAKDKKPRKLFGELTNVVTGQHGEVVDISQDTFGRKMRRERRASSSLPGKDPLTWTEFKEMLPAELMQTINGEDFARSIHMYFSC